MSIWAIEFQHAYLGKFKMETERLDDTSFDLLDRLFGDVDAYTSDQGLLDENPSHYLDETCLRTRVEQTLNYLQDR